MPVAAVALGSNVGDRAASIRKALGALRALGEVSAVSRLYESPPWGVQDQPAFVNAVALVRTDLPPHSLLSRLQKIERELGRTPTYAWGPRVIDLDIIYYDELRLDDPDLKIPHPHLEKRAFVLVPLAEVDTRYAAAAAAAPDRQTIKALE